MKLYFVLNFVISVVCCFFALNFAYICVSVSAALRLLLRLTGSERDRGSRSILVSDTGQEEKAGDDPPLIHNVKQAAAHTLWECGCGVIVHLL